MWETLKKQKKQKKFPHLNKYAQKKNMSRQIGVETNIQFLVAKNKITIFVMRFDFTICDRLFAPNHYSLSCDKICASLWQVGYRLLLLSSGLDKACKVY